MIDKTAGDAPLRELTLPNGMEVFFLSRAETLFVYHEIFVERCYLRDGIVLPERPCVVDVGANIGMFSLFVRNERPSALIHAFEPVPTVHGCLSANFVRAGVTGAAHCNGLADSDESAEFTFFPHATVLSRMKEAGDLDQSWLHAWIGGIGPEVFGRPDGDGKDLSTRLSDRLRRTESMTVRMETASGAMRRLAIDRIDLFKLDVEGSEISVLRGIAPEDWRKIGQFAIEITDEDGSLEELTGLLRARGYSVTVTEGAFFGGFSVHMVYAVRC